MRSSSTPRWPLSGRRFLMRQRRRTSEQGQTVAVSVRSTTTCTWEAWLLDRNRLMTKISELEEPRSEFDRSPASFDERSLNLDSSSRTLQNAFTYAPTLPVGGYSRDRRPRARIEPIEPRDFRVPSYFTTADIFTISYLHVRRSPRGSCALISWLALAVVGAVGVSVGRRGAKVRAIRAGAARRGRRKEAAAVAAAAAAFRIGPR